MNLQTKKILAKEFLILVLTLTLGLLSFLCTFPYNQYKYNQIENFDRTIKKRQKTADSLTIADSLSKIENNLRLIKNPKYKLWQKLNKSSYYTKSYDEFNNQFSNPESIGKLYNALHDSSYYTKSQDAFNQQYFFDIPSSDKLELLYNKLKENQTIKGLPKDYNTFKTVMQDPVKARDMYNALLNNETVTGLPKDFDKFSNTLGLKTKDENSSGLRNISPQSSQAKPDNIDVAHPPPPARRALYKYLVQDKLYTKSFEAFNKQFSMPEKIHKLYMFVTDKGRYSKGEDAFNKQFFPDVPMQTTYNKLPTPDNNQLERDSLIIAKLTTQKSDIEDKILTFKDQVKFGIVMTIIFSLFFFGFRYLFYAVKWSVKTLKQ